LFVSLKEGWAQALGLPSGRFPSRRSFGVAEEQAVRRVFRHYAKEGKDFGYQGHFEEKYCRAWVDYLGGRGFADGVATGTAAVYAGLAALRLPAGSEVGVSPITDPGTVNAIILNGLVPVLVDAMPGSYNIGPEQLSRAISPKMRALVVVHCHGMAAPISGLVAMARARRVAVMEDCSQAHGASLGGKKVGTFGDIAAFSTMYRKAHATGGCGGVVYTRDRSLYWKARSYADRGKPFGEEPFDEKDVRLFKFPALNLNLDELSCAIGTVTLKELDITIKKRFALWKSLKQRMNENKSSFVIEEFSEEDSIFFIPLKKPAHWELELKHFGPYASIFNFSYKYLVSEWQWARGHLVNPENSFSQNAKAKRDSSIHLLLNENFSSKDLYKCAKLL